MTYVASPAFRKGRFVNMKKMKDASLDANLELKSFIFFFLIVENAL